MCVRLRARALAQISNVVVPKTKSMQQSISHVKSRIPEGMILTLLSSRCDPEETNLEDQMKQKLGPYITIYQTSGPNETKIGAVYHVLSNSQ